MISHNLVIFLLTFFALWTLLVISAVSRFVIYLQREGHTIESAARGSQLEDADDEDDEDESGRPWLSNNVGPMGPMGPKGDAGEKGEPGRNAVCVCGPTPSFPAGWQRAYVDQEGDLRSEKDLLNARQNTYSGVFGETIAKSSVDK